MSLGNKTRARFAEPVESLLRIKGATVWSIGPDATVYDAIEMMAEKGIGALPVVSGGALTGMISERDYTRKIILQGRNSRDTPVSEIMTSPVKSVSPSDSLDDCMRIMTQEKIRHLPVVAGGELTGMLSIGDVVKWMIQMQDHTIGQLERYIAGEYPT
ncbi:MAG: CBS domain-containing protein [Acidobacteria bacterium]|nr:CBS domain-containing protein [Acidobacteriota bacterium]